MKSISEVLSFDKLKKHSLDGDLALHKTINRLSGRHAAKEVKKTSFFEWVNPRAEVKRLRAFIEAMREEEHTAAKNSLDLYAENESLRQYKELAVNGPAQFAPIDEYERVKKELNDTKKKLAGVSLALNEQMKAWNEYMQAVPFKRDKAK